MKNRIKILFILALLPLLLVVSCKKDVLPKATQTGASIMSAKVNGKAWQKKACTSCIGGGSALKVSYDDRDFFAVRGQQNEQEKIEITLVIASLKTTGTYDLGEKNLNFAELYKNKENTSYYTSVKNRGRVTITKLDLINKIISGTFDFTVEDENNPANTIKVTEGRFDVKYY